MNVFATKYALSWLMRGWLVASLMMVACEDGGSSDPAADNGAGQNGNVSDYSGPPSGIWAGDYLDIMIEAGQVTMVTLRNIQCSLPNADFPGLTDCKSEVVEGDFDAGVVGALSVALKLETVKNQVTGLSEWHLRGSVGPLSEFDGIFFPMEGPPAEFSTIKGTFLFKATDCECESRITFQAKLTPPDQIPDPNDPGNGGGTVGPDDPGGTYPEDSDPQQIKALERVNWYREQLELPMLNAIAPLNAMAMDHCACYSQNQSKYGGMSPHDENAAWGPPCYGGLGERASAKGYNGGGLSEVMAFVNDPYKSVDGWIATLYHRLPLTDPSTTEMGYGHAPGCDTINSGGSGSSSNWEVAYPYDGQTGVDTFWNGYESPQPPPPANGYPSGPIITVQFGSGVTFSITDSSIEDEWGNPVPHTLLTPKNDQNLAWSAALSLYSDDPLKPGVEYTVYLQGTKVNQPWEKTWSFQTAPMAQGQ